MVCLILVYYSKYLNGGSVKRQNYRMDLDLGSSGGKTVSTFVYCAGNLKCKNDTKMFFAIV